MENLTYAEFEERYANAINFAHEEIWDYAYYHDDILFPVIMCEDYDKEEWNDFLGEDFLSTLEELAGTTDDETIREIFAWGSSELEDGEYEDWDTYWNPNEDDEEDEDEDY